MTDTGRPERDFSRSGFVRPVDGEIDAVSGPTASTAIRTQFDVSGHAESYDLVFKVVYTSVEDMSRSAINGVIRDKIYHAGTITMLRAQGYVIVTGELE